MENEKSWRVRRARRDQMSDAIAAPKRTPIAAAASVIQEMNKVATLTYAPRSRNRPRVWGLRKARANLLFTGCNEMSHISRLTRCCAGLAQSVHPRSGARGERARGS